MYTTLVGGIVGGVYINAEMTNFAGKDSITFTPTCDQIVDIEMHSHNAKGNCHPSGTIEVKAGTPQPIQAVITSCKGHRKWFCGKCSLKCSARYK